MTRPSSYSRVLLGALHFDARIGYYSSEKHAPQPLVAHVELTLDVDGFGDEDISRTVDYTRIAAIAHELASSHTDLIETFAERFAGRCLDLPLVVSALIRIEKPLAVPGAVAGVEILRRRA